MNVKRFGIGWMLFFCTILIALTIVGSVFTGVWLLNRGAGQKVGYTGIDSNRYQAVFLANGQVYFGKLSDNGSELVNLRNIWYLQVQEGTKSADSLKDNQGQVALAKLGNELHGPDDSMSISKLQILFWENLTDNSKVVKAIQAAK